MATSNKYSNSASATKSTVKCGVETCAHHTASDYCALPQIQVGACTGSVTQCQNTECASFQLNNESGCR